MRSKLLVWMLFVAFIGYGQEKLNTLTTPTSPAASLLGMQPSAILKPKSFRALEAAVYSNFTDESGNGIIPNDFGLEFMPYWANPHGISLEEYLYPKANFSQILRNSSFSLASTQNFKLQDSTSTKSIAFGYRTSIFFGNNQDKEKITGYITDLSQNQKIGAYVLSKLIELEANNNFTSKEEYLQAIQPALTNRISAVLKPKSAENAEKIVENIYLETEALPFDTANLDGFYTAFCALIEKKVGGSYDEFKTYIKNRQGLAIDFAFALHLNFPDNNFNFSEVPKHAFWLSPSYNFSKNLEFLKATATLRYERYNTDYFEKYFPDSEVYDNNFDYGVALSGNFKKWSIELEATGRNSNSLIESGQDADGNPLYRKESNNDFQYIGTFSYRLTEQIVLSYQFGSAFEPVFNINGGTLVSLLSLNFGFGGPNKNDVIMQ